MAHQADQRLWPAAIALGMGALLLLLLATAVGAQAPDFTVTPNVDSLAPGQQVVFAMRYDLPSDDTAMGAPAVITATWSDASLRSAPGGVPLAQGTGVRWDFPALPPSVLLPDLILQTSDQPGTLVMSATLAISGLLPAQSNIVQLVISPPELPDLSTSLLILDPQEQLPAGSTLDMTVDLRNTGSGTADNITVALTSNTPVARWELKPDSAAQVQVIDQNATQLRFRLAQPLPSAGSLAVALEAATSRCAPGCRTRPQLLHNHRCHLHPAPAPPFALAQPPQLRRLVCRWHRPPQPVPFWKA